MKNLTKQIITVVLCLILVLSFAGCAKTGTLTNPIFFDENHPVKKEDSFIAAENDIYQLKWDAETKRIVLYDKIKDVNWSNTPYDVFEPQVDEFGDTVNNNPRLETTLLIEYIETENFTIKSANGYVQSLNRGNYAVEKFDNGFTITYYFDTLGISIPVSYTLNKDGFSVSVDPSKISEDGSNLLYRIQLAPFVCSVPNLSNDSYLFYPSGNGALIYSGLEEEVGNVQEYAIYGGDSMYIPVVSSYVSNTEEIKMPVYGAKNGDKAVLAIIKEGAETATLCSNVGDASLGHSAVYPIFSIRGKQTTAKAANNSTQYTDQYTSAKIEIAFCPLYDDDADYVGMANKYREYLIDEKGLTDKQEKSSLSLSLIGGTQIPDSFLGIPTTKIFATTTVTQAGEIIKDLSDNIKLSLVADLFGFGESGIDIGKPAGGLDISSSIGTKKQVKKLSEMCAEENVELFFNYDMLYFDENGSGLTTVNGGAAKGPSKTYSKKNGYFLGHNNKNADVSYYHIGRLELPDLASKVIDNCNSMELYGFSSRNLSNVVYSDCADNRFISAGNMATDVTAILNKVKESGLAIMGYSANDYYAALSDVIIEAPVHSNFYNFFDEDVPFYQIVFKGYTPIYGTALNTVTDTGLEILRCIESGSGLRYSVINNYSVDLATSSYQMFGTRLYSDLRDDIIETADKYTDFYEAINDAKIINHQIVNEDVRKVTYDNGVTVYVNYGKTDYVSEYGVVEAESYIYLTDKNASDVNGGGR